MSINVRCGQWRQELISELFLCVNFLSVFDVFLTIRFSSTQGFNRETICKRTLGQNLFAINVNYVNSYQIIAINVKCGWQQERTMSEFFISVNVLSVLYVFVTVMLLQHRLVTWKPYVNEPWVRIY